MKRGPVAITGRGCVGAPGCGLAAQAAALAAGRCGLAVRERADLPLSGGMMIGYVDAVLPSLASRTAALGAAAAEEALAEAGLGVEARAALPLIAATCTAGMGESEQVYLGQGGQKATSVYLRHPIPACARLLARWLGLRGSVTVHSEACASSACALAEAMEMVRQGDAPRVLVVGMDAITRLTMAGFASLQVVDRAGCRPFTEERRGMSLGEGAAALVLEHPEAAASRGAATRGRLLGWGLSADAHHATAPHPDGVQLRQAVDTALADAGLDPAAIDYVCAHGTGTQDNDAVEARVCAALFGDGVPVASWKRVYGHTMGACAAIEAVGSTLALERGIAFPSAGVELGTPLSGLRLSATAASLDLERILSTTLAFGGINAALVIARSDACA